MIRRSECGHRRSIRRSVWIKTETRQDEAFSTSHTRFSVENRMHLICVPGSQFHTYDRFMSVISQDVAQNAQKRFINFYYTHEGRHEGLYTNNDNYEHATPSSSSTVSISSYFQLHCVGGCIWKPPIVNIPAGGRYKPPASRNGTICAGKWPM
jgi:hypothetical protein